MLGLLNNQNNMNTTKYEPTFVAFYTIVKGLFIMLPAIYTERHHKTGSILKYFGENSYNVKATNRSIIFT